MPEKTMLLTTSARAAMLGRVGVAARMCRAAALLFLAAASLAQAAPRQLASPLVGQYRGGAVDTASELLVLDDNTFCFMLSAGNMDKLVGGKWERVGDRSKKAAGKGQVEIFDFQEVRSPREHFPLRMRQMDLPQSIADGQRVLRLNGYVFAETKDAVMGFDLANVRPLFASGKRSYSRNYHLPIPPGASHFYVGQLLPHSASGMVTLTQYRIDDVRFNTAELGYDHDAVRLPFSWQVQLEDKSLNITGEQQHMRMKKVSATIEPEIRRQVQDRCLDPSLLPAGVVPLAVREMQQMPFSKPERTVQVPVASIRNEAWVGQDD